MPINAVEEDQKKLDDKKEWSKPECSQLSTKDTEGGGFGGNETTTTKPGS